MSISEQIKNIQNRLDQVKWNSGDVEKQIEKYSLEFINILRNDIEWGMSLKSLIEQNETQNKEGKNA